MGLFKLFIFLKTTELFICIMKKKPKGKKNLFKLVGFVLLKVGDLCCKWCSY